VCDKYTFGKVKDMNKFDLKLNVAKNYSFPFSRGALKKIAEENPSIKYFSYRGISPHNQINDNGNEIWLGEVVGKKSFKTWDFSLYLYANNNEYIDAIINLCQETILNDMITWINVQKKQPETFPDGVNRLYISINKVNEKYISSSTEHTKTQW